MNKDIFFYSEYCDYSKEVRSQLDTYGQLPKMISVCVDDENIQLPPFLEAVPTIYLNENKSILVDESIEKYINKFKPNEQQNSIGDWDSSFGASGASGFSYIEDDSQTETFDGGNGFASINYDFSVKQMNEEDFKKRTMEDLEKERSLDMSGIKNV